MTERRIRAGAAQRRQDRERTRQVAEQRTERRDGTRSVSTRYKDSEGNVDDSSRDAAIPGLEFPVGAPVSKVAIGSGGTYNLGNFNTLRIDVRIEVPCMPGDERETADRVSRMVENTIRDEESKWLTD